MLPRVSAALAQLIAPIATSTKNGLNPQERPFERFQQPGKKDPGKQSSSSQQNSQQGTGRQPEQGAQVIPFPAVQAKNEKCVSSGGMPTGITQALLQLMTLLQDQRSSVMKWLGRGIYQAASRQQKKNGRIRKGAVLDEKAE